MGKKKAAAGDETVKKPRGATRRDAEMGQRLRLRRVEQGMSQSELGEALGVSFQQVQKYEKGVNRIAAPRIEQIAKLLEVPVTFFFGNGHTVAGGNSAKNQTEIESLLFLDSSFSLRLLRAYAAIPDQDVQRQFVSLMEKVAGISKE